MTELDKMIALVENAMRKKGLSSLDLSKLSGIPYSSVVSFFEGALTNYNKVLLLASCVGVHHVFLIEHDPETTIKAENRTARYKNKVADRKAQKTRKGNRVSQKKPGTA